ncbi:glycosyl transferase family 2 [Phyllobacterium sophorae]|uniref:Glycosyl transferase family 2 n=2 Tax=Phyllobacterium sophorae TaxID=1520277 RepID=A0A2P7B5M6_9HYPH|nr:glycosyl transferase family 2 [Phyllobacterium sophorae]
MVFATKSSIPPHGIYLTKPRMTLQMIIRKLASVLPTRLRKLLTRQLGRKDAHRRALDAEMAIIRSSGYFDAAFYLRQNLDVAEADVDPLDHYLRHGWREKRHPSRFAGVLEEFHSNPDLRTVLDKFGVCDDWLQPADRRALPNENAVRELVRGTQFSNKFDFSLEPDGSTRRLGEAIMHIAAKKPSITGSKGESPDVSIIIPVYGQTHFVLNCLDSLAEHSSRYNAEVIVIDDASPKQTESQRLGEIPWIRYIRRAQNSGFLDTCNEAAQHAVGKTLVLLNSDTRVVDSWLDELMDSFAVFPDAGLIGSMLINEDGTLQEAGGIYWDDGSAWNYGRNDDPNDPKYCFARRVDYCSAAAIAVPTTVWRRVGGFDPEFRPAYAEDADLAFRIRQEGLETWYQPLSKVIHYEGMTHGRDLSKGGKAYQVANMAKFKNRWAAILKTHGTSGVNVINAANRCAKKRLLVIDSITPTPDQDSGSFITEKMIRAYQELGYAITFVPQNAYRWVERYSADLQRLGVECLYDPFCTSIEQVVTLHPDFDAILAYRFGVLSQVYDLLRQQLPLARLIFHNVDLHYLREQREAELHQDQAQLSAAKITQSMELEVIAKSDCNIVHTAVEAAIIREQVPIDNIIEFPYISEVHRTGRLFDDRRDIMFLGGFAHVPNIDGILDFHENVWPKIISKLPDDAQLLIVGADPTKEVLALAGARTTVTGYVEELEPWFDRARVFVAPLRYGAGIKGKLIQSLSFGVPSVATSVAAEGIGLTSDREAIIADNADDFANAVVELYGDREKWGELRKAGFDLVEKNYSWNRCLELCQRALDVADATWVKRIDHQRKRRLETILADDGRI